MRVCVFQIKGLYGHWRKWFTTTSPLTYSFPPRTSVIGLIGAILGIEREKIPKVFPISSTHIGICPVRPIVKHRMPENWRQSPLTIRGAKVDKQALEKFNEGFQANLEIIRNPAYRIVFSHNNGDGSLMDDLVSRLKEKRWTFQPYLGIMGFLADVDLETEDEALEQSAERFELHSVLPLSEVTERTVDVSESSAYTREERVPLDVLPGRQFRYLNVAYVESNGKPLIVRGRSGHIRFCQLAQLKINVIFLQSCAS